MSLTGAPAKPPRFAIVDVLRGAAIVAMVIYHCAWDLSYFQLIPIDITVDTGWRIFQHLILGGFLLLVGVSLVLAHGRGIRWPSFWRRFAMIAAGAAAVTIGTYILFPETFVFFGILHAIALFSLMALPFLRLPPWLTALVGAVFLIVPLFFSNVAFNDPRIAWIGFWEVPPATNDLVPIFPWFGMVLVGMALARLVLASPLATTIAAWKPASILRPLIVLGRWSLIIYLVHQPILLGIIYPIANARPADAPTRVDSFVSSCVATCKANGNTDDHCTAYCGCAVERIVRDDLWSVIEQPTSSPEQNAAIADIARQCTATMPSNLGVTPPAR